MRIDVIAFPRSLLLFGGDALPTRSAYCWLLEQRLWKLHGGGVKPRATIDAQTRCRLVARMNISANKAKLGADHARFDSAGRHHARSNSVLAAFMIDDVARPEFGEPKKTRPVDRMRLRCPRH